MINTDLIPFFRTEYLQDKILVEKTLEEAGIEFELDAPRIGSANSIYQEQGPWEFSTTMDRLYEAEKCVDFLPVDNLLKSPQAAPKTTSIQKAWAWVAIVIFAVFVMVEVRSCLSM